MGVAVSGMCQLIPGVSASEPVEIRRSTPWLALEMVESVGEPGEVPALPQPQLVLSQALGHSFHYQCDLGAGRFSGQSIPMDFVLVMPHAHTWCRIDNPHRLRFLGIPLKLVRHFLDHDQRGTPDFGVLHTRHNHDPFIAHTLEALWQELGQGDQISRLFVETAIAGLLVRLQRLSEQIPVRPLTPGGLAARQSARVLEYMRENLAQPLSLGELAGQAGLSPWHFARAFRHSHGLPPHRYLTWLRLEKARELLVHSALSVTEIAAITGYSSQHLARHFRRNMGCTPNHYRRQQKY